MIGAASLPGKLLNLMINKEKNEHPRSKEAIRTWLRLLSCESVIERELRSQFRESFKITLPQFDVLSELERSGNPMTMSELSRELMVSNGNVTGVIDRLEKGGLVSRTRAEHDRRVQFIALTADGRRRFGEMARHHEAWLDELFAELSIEEMNSLQKLLLKARSSASH
jgi:DNA-binding MarR family transcriptional regulator